MTLQIRSFLIPQAIYPAILMEKTYIVEIMRLWKEAKISTQMLTMKVGFHIYRAI